MNFLFSILLDVIRLFATNNEFLRQESQFAYCYTTMQAIRLIQQTFQTYFLLFTSPVNRSRLKWRPSKIWALLLRQQFRETPSEWISLYRIKAFSSISTNLNTSEFIPNDANSLWCLKILPSTRETLCGDGRWMKPSFRRVFLEPFKLQFVGSGSNYWCCEAFPLREMHEFLCYFRDEWRFLQTEYIVLHLKEAKVSQDWGFFSKWNSGHRKREINVI